MKQETAFVGDVHGNIEALQGMWAALDGRGIQHAVFLGDYINKGPASAAVLSVLSGLAASGRATLLLGNHEIALLDALRTHDLAPFLKMGGAMTVRSYVRSIVGPDVLAEFTAAIPRADVALLLDLDIEYKAEGVIARHTPWDVPPKEYAISAHRPVGKLPKIGQTAAHIDTGCGDPGGRLTALLWPSLDYIQVDERGRVINSKQ